MNEDDEMLFGKEDKNTTTTTVESQANIKMYLSNEQWEEAEEEDEGQSLTSSSSMPHL